MQPIAGSEWKSGAVRPATPSLIEENLSDSNSPYSPEEKRHIESVSNNVVGLVGLGGLSGGGPCTGTYITPTCILTAAHCRTRVPPQTIRTEDRSLTKLENDEVIHYEPSESEKYYVKTSRPSHC